MLTDLSTVLTYRNNKIVEYFCHNQPQYSLQESHVLFSDLLAWLWLKQFRASQQKKTYLFGPLLILDELWHVFILHTRDYINFSMHYFGHYCHHDVEPVGAEHQLAEDELRDFLEDCFTHLDAGWVKRRFTTALLE